MQISAVKSHADDAHWNYFSALLKTNCWYNCNLKKYTCRNGKRKVCPVDSRVQHAFRRLTRFMLAFIKTKGHKNESKLFKCLENAKTFLKVFLYWCLFIDLNVSVYQWQIKVNNSRLSIAYFCAKNKKLWESDNSFKLSLERISYRKGFMQDLFIDITFMSYSGTII